MPRITVKQRPINELSEYEANPRAHPTRQIEALAESMRTFGFTAPILITDNGEVVAGHGRLEAAKHMGLDTVPTITLQDLTPEQVRAYRIADNKLAEMSKFNEALLIEEMAAVDIDWGSFGFSDAELLAMQLSDYGDEDGGDERPERASNNFVSLSFAMSAEQRALVFDAIRACKQHHSLDDNAEALIKICREFTNGIQAS